MGALVVLVAVQLSVAGSVASTRVEEMVSCIVKAPPHIIISLPVHTSVWPSRASGTFKVVVAVQVSSLQAGAAEISGSI